MNIFEGDLDQCYGCKSCQMACPVEAIEMKTDDEGFWFPEINAELCIHCNRCTQSCPVISDNLKKIQYPLSKEVYAAWNKDLSSIMLSSSGAIFPLLAGNILKKGGSVYGCAWSDNNTMVAQHIRITDINQLIRLRGSRYVQSNVNGTYLQVKKDLKDGLAVLFSGTPCQIAGLRLFLGKMKCDSLYTIDLVCHGVPSPKMLSEYIDYINRVKKVNICNLKFRDKRKSGWAPWVSWQVEGSYKKKFTIPSTNPYLYGFYAGYLNRESCYQCKFSAPQRVGDITLADYWGVELSHPELEKHHKYGISLVICNSINGLNLFNEISNELTKVPSTIENAAKRNQNLIKTRVRPNTRSIIYQDVKNNGFRKVACTTLRSPYFYAYKFMPEVILNIVPSVKRWLK